MLLNSCKVIKKKRMITGRVWTENRSVSHNQEVSLTWVLYLLPCKSKAKRPGMPWCQNDRVSQRDVVVWTEECDLHTTWSSRFPWSHMGQLSRSARTIIIKAAFFVWGGVTGQCGVNPIHELDWLHNQDLPNLICNSQSVSVGSLSLVYMRRLDALKPRAAVPERPSQASPAIRDGNQPSPERQWMHHREAGTPGPERAWLASLDKTAHHSVF